MIALQIIDERGGEVAGSDHLPAHDRDQHICPVQISRQAMPDVRAGTLIEASPVVTPPVRTQYRGASGRKHRCTSVP
jgi:hypothetical protein